MPVNRFLSLSIVPAVLVLAGCPPQEEPVHVGKVEAKAQPEPEKKEAQAPAPAKVDPEPAPEETTGELVPVDTAAPGPDDTANPEPEPKPNPSPKPEPKPDAIEAPADVDGKTVFTKKCKNCHGMDGKADTKMGKKHDIPDMTAGDWDRKWPRAKVIKIVREGKKGTKMRAFKDKLSAEEIEAVASFTRSL